MKKREILITLMVLGCMVMSLKTQAVAEDLHSDGKLRGLRVQEVGDVYGGGNDQLNVQVVVWLDSTPGQAFGFQLLNDANALAHQAMLDVLRDAFSNDWKVRLEYSIEEDKRNGTIFRVIVSK